MSQKLTVNGFECVKHISSMNKKLKTFIKIIKNHDEDSDKRCILEIDVEYSKNSHVLHSDFYLKKCKLINAINFKQSLR